MIQLFLGLEWFTMRRLNSDFFLQENELESVIKFQEKHLVVELWFFFFMVQKKR